MQNMYFFYYYYGMDSNPKSTHNKIVKNMLINHHDTSVTIICQSFGTGKNTQIWLNKFLMTVYYKRCL